MKKIFKKKLLLYKTMRSLKTSIHIETINYIQKRNLLSNWFEYELTNKIISLT